MTRRSWLIVVAAVVVVVGGIVGAVIAFSGSGSGGTHQAASGSPHITSPTPAPRLPSICPALPNGLVAKQLHVSVGHAVPASTQFLQSCRWLDTAGDPVLSVATNTQPTMLLLHTLGNDGAVKVAHFGGQAIFAPRPPQLAFVAAQTGVVVRIEPAGYRALLPAGTTNPARIPRGRVLPTLVTFGHSVTKFMTH